MTMAQYSSFVGSIYVFNLLIGGIVIALPKIFSDAGLALGTVLITLMCLGGYTTTCYVIEAMAATSAYQKLTDNEKIQVATEMLDVVAADGDIEKEKPRPDCSPEDYEIPRKFEYSSIAKLFFPKFGVVLQYLVLCLTLYGEIAFMNVLIATSLSHLTCLLYSHYFIINALNGTWFSLNGTLLDMNESLELTNEAIDECFSHLDKTKLYYTYLALFILIFGPLAFFNMSSSKFLQILTMFARCIGIGLMVFLSVLRLIEGHRYLPQVGNLKSLPVLYGLVIYCYKVQEYIPSVIAPMSSKAKVYRMLFRNFIAAWLLQLVIIYTSAFSFPGNEINVLYTLNFFQPMASDSFDLRLSLGAIIVLLPLITLASTYPVATVILRKNLKALTIFAVEGATKKKVKIPFVVDRLLLPLLALTPPLIIACVTQNIELVGSITGSFSGIFIQCVIPAVFIIVARYKIKKVLGVYNNPYKTPLSHIGVVIIIIVWSIISVIMMSVNLVLNLIGF